jgi:hypothetical protein
MFRISVLALAAAAALGTVALTPTTASADWHGWRHRDAVEDRFERRDRAEDRFERRDRIEDRFEHRFGDRDADDCLRVRQFWTPWGFASRRFWVCS